MNARYIIALVEARVLTQLEHRLRALGVGGIAVEKVTRFGACGEFLGSDWMTDYTRLEIYAEESKVAATVGAITDTAKSLRSSSGGVVAVIPIETLIVLPDQQK